MHAVLLLIHLPSTNTTWCKHRLLLRTAAPCIVCSAVTLCAAFPPTVSATDPLSIRIIMCVYTALATLFHVHPVLSLCLPM